MIDRTNKIPDKPYCENCSCELTTEEIERGENICESCNLPEATPIH